MSARKWNRFARAAGWVTVVFIVQIVLIVWMSGGSKPPLRKLSPAPTLALASAQSMEFVALNDPTLFALPHYRAFSGPAWLRPRSIPEPSFQWSDEPRWLPPSTNEFLNVPTSPGADLDISELVKTTPPPPPQPIVSVPPQFPRESLLRLQGIGRTLISAPALPVWSSTNLLTNTVVRLMIDPKGIVRSQTLLVRSGLPGADQFASDASRKLRFTPATESASPNDPAAGMTWGQAVFQWRNSMAPGGGQK